MARLGWHFIVCPKCRNLKIRTIRYCYRITEYTDGMKSKSLFDQPKEYTTECMSCGYKITTDVPTKTELNKKLIGEKNETI